MKNQFNKLTQGIFEAFKGPRTKDYEFDKMEQEYNINKERLISLKTLIDSYPKRLEGYKSTIEELTLSFQQIFEGDKSMYSKYMSDVTNAHKALNDKLIEMFTRIENLKSNMDQWTKNCATVDEKIKAREDTRKNFDHYDEKMGDLYEERQKIFAKGDSPDEKDEERFTRNIKKYQDAAKAYVDATNEAYKFICYFIDSKYENVSIGVAEFLDIELIFYLEAYKIFNYFRNIKNNVLTIKQSFKAPIRNYEAADYIRGKSLLNLNVEEMMKNTVNISGVIEGKSDNSNKNEIKNEKNNFNNNSSSFHQNQSSFSNNNNNFSNNYNNHYNPNTLLNPYTNNQNQQSTSYGFYKSNVDNNHINDPFSSNNPNNPFLQNNNNNTPSQPRNPYSQGSSYIGENPFNKPNI